MTTVMTLAKRRGAALLIVPAAVVIIALAFAIGHAEASDEEYGDSATPSGPTEIDGDPAFALGPPDEDIVQIGTAASGGVGSLTVTFTDDVAYNGTGDDLLIHVLDADFPATATIEVSADGVTFVTVGDFPDTANIPIDLEDWGLDYAVAVRITQVSGELPGFDLDAVEALNVLVDAVVVATPDIDENPGLTSHTVTANVTDGVAVQGAVVSFVVTAGPNSPEADSDTTNAAGDATFDYIGDGGPGLDAITAWLDINGNGTPDEGEPSDVVTKLWHGVTGTIDLTDPDGGGVVVGDTLQVEVDDADLDVTAGADVVTVMVTSTSDPIVGLTALVLTETGGSTGVFQGTVLLVDTLTTQATAELLAADGDTSTASYDDALDGTGNAVTVTSTLVVTDVETDDEGVEKVTICHVPSGNPENQHTITVGAPAVPAHLAHGDALDECGEYDGPTKQESQFTSFCERNPDHQRCDAPDSTGQGNANVEVEDADADGDDEGDAAELAAFCERKPDHKRCEGLSD